MGKRDSPPDPVHCVEVEQSIQVICPAPGSLFTGIYLTLVVQILGMRCFLFQQLLPAKPSCLADLDAWGGSKPQGWAGSALYCLHVYIFMALLTPDNLIILNFVFVTFLKYHLRNLSFLGYSQCLFLGQRRPTHCIDMPYYLFSFSITGVSIPAVAASLH